jgi:IS4 transposase
VFLTNHFDLEAEMIAQIYKKRWQIELLFKQLKQNFPLKYFLGDNENAIEIQIWIAMIANLLITLLKSKLKRNWAFSNLVSIIRQQLMNYIDIYAFLENPEKAWLELLEKKKDQYEHSLFPLG